MIKNLAKRLLYPHAYSSEAFERHLRSKGVAVGKGCHFFDPHLITIDLQRPHMLELGDYVKLTAGVHILCHDYSRSVVIGAGGGNFGEAARTVIGDNVFVGSHAVILMGAKIGANSIVGAGAVVSGSFPEESVIAGNPAKRICSLEEYAERRTDRELDAAVLFARDFRSLHGSWPTVEQMTNAFAWLYLPHTEATLAEHSGLFELNGVDRELMRRTFLATRPRFDRFDDFIAYCTDGSRLDDAPRTRKEQFKR